MIVRQTPGHLVVVGVVVSEWVQLTYYHRLLQDFTSRIIKHVIYHIVQLPEYMSKVKVIGRWVEGEGQFNVSKLFPYADEVDMSGL